MPTPLVWQITATGISVPTQTQLLAYWQAVYLEIYGVDVTTQDPSSPDNQFINNIVQQVLDVQDVVVQSFNSFDPDNALGTVLDQRVALNGIQRIAATYSTITVNITISTTSTLSLYGLDQTANQVFTVQDSAANQWQLLFSQYNLGSGTYSLSFQAALPGSVTSAQDTVTIVTTPVIGVTSVNNPTAQTYVGVNEESDNALKIRRQKSVSQPSQGYLDGLLASLSNITGVTYANVIENDTSDTILIGPDAGLPGHSIWCIIAAQDESSTTLQSNIASAIYAQRNAGCGMYGAQSFVVTRRNGNSITMYWDWVLEVPVFLEFQALSIDGVNLPLVLNIQSTLPTLLTPGVSETLTGNAVSTAVQLIDPNTFITNPGFSAGVYQVFYFSGVAASGSFYFTYNGNATVSIAWNASAATIQTDLRTLTGLGSVVVTGSIANQNLMVWMNGVTNPLLIGVETDTLVTSGSVPVNVTQLVNQTNFVQTIYFSTVPASGAFKITYNGQNSTSIAAAASIATIQTDIQALTGLSSVTVSGSIASQTLAIVMLGVVSPQLLSVTSNTLLNAGSVEVTATVSNNFPSFLPVLSSINQYEIESANTIILSQPGYIFLSVTGSDINSSDIVYTFVNGVVQWPFALSIAASGTATFSGSGGYGSFTYSCLNGTINATTGVYTAPSTGTDTVTVTDVLGNIATCLVTT